MLLALLLPVPPGESLADAAFSPNVTPDLDIHRSRGAIDIDGEIGDAGWRGAARAGNFIETTLEALPL